MANLPEKGVELIEINARGQTIAKKATSRRRIRGKSQMTERDALLAILVSCAIFASLSRASAQDALAGAAVFKSQCGICHSPQQGRNMTGPSLFDVVGRPAGKVAGFHYSPANRDSGLTWDAATLDRYLTSPATVVPHTIMTYAGLKDPAKRTDLIAYLSTLR